MQHHHGICKHGAVEAEHLRGRQKIPNAQMYLSINARPGAAQKTLLLFTVQLFLTTTRGQSLLPDEKSCESSR